MNEIDVLQVRREAQMPNLGSFGSSIPGMSGFGDAARNIPGFGSIIPGRQPEVWHLNYFFLS